MSSPRKPRTDKPMDPLAGSRKSSRRKPAEPPCGPAISCTAVQYYRAIPDFAACSQQSLSPLHGEMLDAVIIRRMAYLAIPEIRRIPSARRTGETAMIWAALSIGVTVLLAIWTVRPRSSAALDAPFRWLVLPDEPVIPNAIVARRSLPALAVTYPAWRGSDESWRAEKPLQPWFRSYAPYAAVAVFGALSLDLSAQGMGVPEIVPTHHPVYEQASHQPGDIGLQQRVADADPSSLTSTWFDAPHSAVFDTAAIAPSWQAPPEIHHDWWA